MMSHEIPKDDDAVSALADGQLRGAEFANAVTRTLADADARAAWHAYHVVGDVLRSRELADCAADRAFVSRFRSRLGGDHEASAIDAQELDATALQNASNLIASQAVPTRASLDKALEVPSANDARFRWKLLAGVASMAAVAAIGWNLLGGSAQRNDAQQLAQTQSSSPPQAPSVPVLAGATPEQAVMIRDPHLDALMAAHKQFGGTSALQMPAGFLRNATFEQASR